jgi:hypothetical protein
LGPKSSQESRHERRFLEGLRNSRIFDPETNTWSQTGEMSFGRWYPTMVTLGDGTTFIASGVRKLIKPIYPDAP